MQYIIANVVGVWVLCLAIAVMMKKGKDFAWWTWGVLSNPFVIIWHHYGTHILTLLIGIAIGVYYAPNIIQFFAK